MQDFNVDNPWLGAYISTRIGKEIAMSTVERKQAIFQTFQDRQAVRRDEMLAERAAETEASILDTEVETRMEIGKAVEFLLSDGDRDAAAAETA
jgi:hypothetical protein